MSPLADRTSTMARIKLVCLTAGVALVFATGLAAAAAPLFGQRPGVLGFGISAPGFSFRGF